MKASILFTTVFFVIYCISRHSFPAIGEAQEMIQLFYCVNDTSVQHMPIQEDGNEDESGIESLGLKRDDQDQKHQY